MGRMCDLEASQTNFPRHLLYFALVDPQPGIMHIIGPKQGFTLPCATILCGVSHNATHGVHRRQH